MTSCHSVGTPMPKKPLDVDLSGTPVDQTKYHIMVGALMYLTASRPDIVHATCYCARYQVRPTEKHLKEVKRIIRFSPSPPANRRPATTSGQPPLPEKFSGEIFRRTSKFFPVSRSIQPTTTNSAAAPPLQPAPPWQPHPATTTTDNNIITIRTTLMPPSPSPQQPHAPPPSTAAAVDTTPATPSSPPLTPQLDTITITANYRTPPPHCLRHHSSHSGGFSNRYRSRGGLGCPPPNHHRGGGRTTIQPPQPHLVVSGLWCCTRGCSLAAETRQPYKGVFVSSLQQQESVCLAAETRQPYKGVFVSSLQQQESVCLAAETRQPYKGVFVSSLQQQESVCLAAETRQPYKGVFVSSLQQQESVCLAAETRQHKRGCLLGLSDGSHN
nr:hypothetical protein [Tanacetum cinerariifolium]